MSLRDDLRSALLPLVIAQNADLRDRLRIMAPMVCEECGCAPVFSTYARCSDCLDADCPGVCELHEHSGACISVGLRRLCGRRILEGC